MAKSAVVLLPGASAMNAAIGYVRAITGKQGDLDLVAQQLAVVGFARAEGYSLVRTFQESDIGSHPTVLDGRPQLKAALAAARENNAVIIVATFNSLGMDADFISDVMTRKISFIVTGSGTDLSAFTLHPYAASLEEVHSVISKRTRDALLPKVRGVKLGGLNAKGVENRKLAQARAEQLRPLLAQFAGMSQRGIAAELNAREIPTPRGGQWHAVTVKRVLGRL
jgi:DNA invertase Pin-like site-specific DNA recombinase